MHNYHFPKCIVPKRIKKTPIIKYYECYTVADSGIEPESHP